MKRFSKLLVVALALVMVIPMIATLLPMEAAAASTAATHVAYENMFDFEDATTGDGSYNTSAGITSAGKLSLEYVQGRLDAGFCATLPEGQSAGESRMASRDPALWTVQTDSNGNNYIVSDTTYTPTSGSRFPMFTIWDETGIMWSQPYEFSFDINPQMSGATGTLLHVTPDAGFSSSKRSLAIGISGYNIRTPDNAVLKTMKQGQWYNVRAQVYPTAGMVRVFIDGSFAAEYTVAKIKTGAESNPTVGAISIGWSTFDYSLWLDNISLRSLAADGVNELIDFTDARITAETETLYASLDEYLNATKGTMATTSSLNISAFSLASETAGDGYLKQSNQSVADTGLAFSGFLDSSDVLDVSMSFRKNGGAPSPAYNLIRLKGSTTVSPLALRGGSYFGIHANGYAVFRKTDSGYVPIPCVSDQWYTFRTQVDIAQATVKLFINNGETDADGELVWEELYFLKNGTENNEAANEDTNKLLAAADAAKKTFSLADFSDKMTTTAYLAWYDYAESISLGTPALWLLYAYRSQWSAEAARGGDVDDLHISTADGSIDTFMDFNYEKVNPANTDWWENDSFVNANSKQAGAKLTDWVAVEDPTGSGRGTILKPSGTMGAFCFNDTKNVLPENVFDIAFDLYMTKHPSNNINLLKLYTNGSTAFNTLQIWTDGGLFVMDNGAREASSIVTLSTNTWYNIRVRFNFVAGEMDIYINGKLIRKADLFALNEGYDFGNVDQMHIAIHSHYEASVKAYHYLDNVAVQVIDTAYPQFEGAELIGVQQSKSGNDVRILAGISNLNYSNVGFTFELLAADGSGWRQVDDRNVNVAYTSITAAGETVNAVDEGCRYFIMAVIKDIDSDGILCIRPYTTRDGVRNYGREGIYFMAVNDGSLSMQEISIASPVGNYELYKEESFENARETFQKYSSESFSETDTGEYRNGGDMASTFTIGAKSTQARTGEKAIAMTGIAPAGSNYSARLKLNHLLPFDFASYEGYYVRISGYIRMDDFTDPDSTVEARWGVMSEATNTEISYTSHHLSEGEWTYVEHEVYINAELIADLGGASYPARVFLGLGSKSKHAATVYMDDIKVEFKKSEGVILPSIFSDGMVLQRNKPINVWGWDAQEGDVITATIGSNSASATADANGEFFITLDAMAVATNQSLTVSNSNGGSISYSDINIGEVWYCSGQSNMELTVSNLLENLAPFNEKNSQIVKNADNYNVRTFKVGVSSKYTLQKDVSGAWSQITSQNVAKVSAIAYIAAYQLQEELGVPVAIIESYKGSSSANAWLSYDKVFADDRAEIYNNPDWIPRKADGSLYTASSGGLEGKTMYEDYAYYWQVGTSQEGTLRDGEHGNTGSIFAPTGLYNGMQGPLAGYSLAGVLWYQGEARTNSLRAEEYNYILHDLVEQWREDFCDENLPVMIIQIAPYTSDTPYYEIRQVQLDTAKRIDNVYAIATAYEGALRKGSGGIYDPNGSGAIHPGTKIPVGTRIFHTMMNALYGADYEYCGPEYDYMEVDGNKAILHFTHLGTGLCIREGDSVLTGFKISGDGVTFVDATATISGDTVVVTAESVASPVAVQYAYVSNVEATEDKTNDTLGGNLENGTGNPAYPFLATLSDVSIYEVSASDGKLYAEIRELGHTVSSYKVKVKIGENTTEYTADFATAGNYVIDGLTVKTGDSVTVTLMTADGSAVKDTKTITVE